MIADPDVGVVLLSLNHEAFVEESIRSVLHTMPPGTPITLVDAGSSDRTVEHARNILSRYPLGPWHVISRRARTVEALGIASEVMRCQYAVLLSTDDVLAQEYGARIQSVLTSLNKSQECVINVGLYETDETLSPKRILKPHWTRFRFLNSILLDIHNPGTAPGAVLPWSLIRNLGILKAHSRSVVEDYVLWTELLPHVRFVNIRQPLVYYRRHSNSQTSGSPNSTYAWSLGYAAGVRDAAAPGFFRRSLRRSLHRRWMGRLQGSVREDYQQGVVEGRHRSRSGIANA